MNHLPITIVAFLLPFRIPFQIKFICTPVSVLMMPKDIAENFELQYGRGQVANI